MREYKEYAKSGYDLMNRPEGNNLALSQDRKSSKKRMEW